MEVFQVILKVVLALVAAVAIVFVVVKYGERICAWFKKLFGCKSCEAVEEPVVEEAPAEEPATEEVPEEEPVVEEVPAEEPVATESDFEG